MAARGARPDRRHRHVAAILGEGRRRRSRSADEQLDAAVTRRPQRRSTRSPRGCARAIGGARVLGVGHRVVHGGARYRGPDRRHAGGSRRAAHAHPAGAAPSAVQPRGDRSGVRAAARRAAGRLLRHQLPPRPARRRRARAAAARDLRVRRAALRLPRPVVRIHRLGPAESGARDRRRTRDRRAPRQRREPVRAAGREERRQHARVHRARRTLHGHAARRGRSRRDPLSVPGSRSCRPRTSRRSSTRNRACSASRGSATTCATC